MSSIFRWLKFSIILIVATPSYVISSEDWTVVVDGSGSMKGFFEQKEIQDYIENLEQKIITKDYQSSTQFFIHNQRDNFEHSLVPYNKDIKKFGNYTDLEVVYSDIAKLNSKAVIVITDNLMSTPLDVKATNQFYKKLSSERVSSLYVVPKLFPFKDRKKNAVIHKGVLIYAILFDPAFTQKFKDVKSFFGSEELLLIKPITRSEIIVNGIIGGENNPNSFVNGQGRLKPIRTIDYQMGGRNRIKFNFSLTSNLPHININAGSYNGKQVTLGISDLKLLTNNRKVRIEKSGNVTPRLLQGNLENSKPNSHIYVATIDFTPSLSWDFSDLWTMVDFVWSDFQYSKIRMKTAFNIEIDVPSSSLSLSNEFAQRYFTADSNEEGKIYSDTDLLRMINTSNLTIKLDIESD